ncbi:MAG: hypothetical protein WDW36_009461 [Sanguina aurantia]
MVTRQKREWMDSQQLTDALATWPEHLFEHFFIVGLPPDSDITQVAEALCGKERRKGGTYDADNPHQGDSAGREEDKKYDKPPSPAFEPQVVFQHPSREEKAAPMSDPEIGAMCFPYQVAPTKLRRTPSLSALNAVIYGKEVSTSDDRSCVFQLKVGGNMPLFGVCVYANEMLHRAPFLARDRYPDCNVPYRRVMISAPRCYCLLTYYPFFVLHFQVLQTILGMERLHRTVQFNKELTAVVFQQQLQQQRTPPPNSLRQLRHPQHHRHSSIDMGSGAAAVGAPSGGRVSTLQLRRSASARRVSSDLKPGSKSASVGGSQGGPSDVNTPRSPQQLHLHQQQLLLQQQLLRHEAESEGLDPGGPPTMSYSLYCSDCAAIMSDMTTQRPSPPQAAAAPLRQQGALARAPAGMRQLRSSAQRAAAAPDSPAGRDVSSAPGSGNSSRRASFLEGGGGGWYATRNSHSHSKSTHDAFSLSLPALDSVASASPHGCGAADSGDLEQDPHLSHPQLTEPNTPLLHSHPGTPSTSRAGTPHPRVHLGNPPPLPHHSRNSSGFSQDVGSYGSSAGAPQFSGQAQAQDPPPTAGMPALRVTIPQTRDSCDVSEESGLPSGQARTPVAGGDGAGPRARQCRVCDASFVPVLEFPEALGPHCAGTPQVRGALCAGRLPVNLQQCLHETGPSLHDSILSPPPHPLLHLHAHDSHPGGCTELRSRLLLAHPGPRPRMWGESTAAAAADVNTLQATLPPSHTSTTAQHHTTGSAAATAAAAAASAAAAAQEGDAMQESPFSALFRTGSAALGFPATSNGSQGSDGGGGDGGDPGSSPPVGARWRRRSCCGPC